MKLFLRFLGVMVVVAAFSACGGGGGDDTSTQTDVPGTDDTCTPVCGEDWECGDDGCGGSCGECTVEGEACKDNMCVPCEPDCDGLVCGDDGCDGSCGTCKDDEVCSADQTECECVPQCEDGWECGPDGCEGECGDGCAEGEKCEDNMCEPCEEDCTGLECGPGPVCGFDCGDCTDLYGPLATCVDGTCECTPDCTDKECGPDGCGGECDPGCDEGVECYQGVCPEDCEIPDAWDPSGYVTTLQSPADGDDVGTLCPDFSGDGVGDNGLKALASMINPELQKAMDEGTFGILFEFNGVQDFADCPGFTLVGLTGEPATERGDDFLIMPESYDPFCDPLISFEDSTLTGGELAAGPSVFTLDLAALGVDEVPLVLTIGDTQLSGTVTKDESGVTLVNGVLAGVLTKELIDEALAVAEEACDVPEPESFCSYLTVAKQFLPMLFDLDLDEDGEKDAASVCFQYKLGAAKITGYIPVEE